MIVGWLGDSKTLSFGQSSSGSGARSPRSTLWFQLDHLREEVGMSKAELARAVGKEPSSIRRFFTADVNPELKTVAAIADALGAKVEVVAA